MATNGNDTIKGTAGDDVIAALGGNDTITASLGNDSINGGAGTDKLIIDQDLSASIDALYYSINSTGLWNDYNAVYTTINGSLAGVSASYIIYFGSLGSTTTSSIEQYQVDLTATQGNDLLIYQNGTRYYGGEGTDTFFANWSKVSTAIVWANNPNLVQVVNGVSVNGLEKLLISTGSANDMLDNSYVNTSNDEFYTNAGNDTITASLGNDTIDGGLGTDKLIINQDLSTSVFGASLYYVINDTSLMGAYNDNYNSINTTLAGVSTSYNIYFGSLGNSIVTGVEHYQVDLTGTNSDDLLIYQNGTHYYGGDGTDSFFANWSAVSTAIVWNNDPKTIQTVNGVNVNSLERLILSTGSGNDVLANNALNTNDELYTNAGNDTITASSGNDTVDGGAGSDKLIVNQDLSAFASTIYYTINGTDLYSDGNSYATINTALAGVSSSYSIYLGSLGTTTATNIEQYQTDLTGTANNDLLIYQNGTRYYGSAGTDSFFANWSKVTTPIIWNNTPNTVQTVNNVSVSGLERLLLTTGSGNDLMANNASNTNDEFYTGAGNDTITASSGYDSIDGGTGIDTFVADWSKVSSAVVWNNLPGTVQNIRNFSIAAMEQLLVSTGSGNDEIRNTKVATNDQLFTGAGNDTIASGEGNDYIDAGKGSDNIDGGVGADTMIGGVGNDKYTVDNIGDVITETSTLSNEIDSVSSSVSYTLSDNVENLTLTGALAIDATANTLDNILKGNGAANILIASAGDDKLTGGAGADILNGGLGQDSIILTEGTAITDTVFIEAGDSLVSSFDKVTGFKLGNSLSSNKAADKLDLPNTIIAANTTVDGINAGVIASHHINKGIISFDDANAYSASIKITATNFNDAINYLQSNIITGETVVFTAMNNTYVFQDGGVDDSLLQLTGVSATSINTTGLSNASLWIA
ncbi:MAG: hypothetical protein WAX77_05370 [Methylococcaceae bacterium]